MMPARMRRCCLAAARLVRASPAFKPPTLLSLALLSSALVTSELMTSAWAQRSPIQAAPLPPLQQQWHQDGTSPIPASPSRPAPTNQRPAPGGPPTPASPSAAAEWANNWLPAQAVRVQALDKVNAQTTALTIKVGQAVAFGSLTITAKACMVRPATQPADAAAYLAVTDAHPDSPGFNGWMLAVEPALSMMQHPVYDIRVTGCA